MPTRCNAGRSAAPPPPAALLAPFCSAHALPWGEKITSLAGPPAERLRRLHRGRVRVELDVPWVLQDRQTPVPPIIDAQNRATRSPARRRSPRAARRVRPHTAT